MKEKSANLFTVIILILLVGGCVKLCSTDENAPDERLNLKINFTGLQLHITNLDSIGYRDLNLQINDKYDYSFGVLPAGETIELGVLNFSDKEGNRMKIGVKPRKVDVECYRNDKFKIETFQFKD